MNVSQYNHWIKSIQKKHFKLQWKSQNIFYFQLNAIYYYGNKKRAYKYTFKQKRHKMTHNRLILEIAPSHIILILETIEKFDENFIIAINFPGKLNQFSYCCCWYCFEMGKKRQKWKNEFHYIQNRVDEFILHLIFSVYKYVWCIYCQGVNTIVNEALRVWVWGYEYEYLWECKAYAFPSEKKTKL